MKIYPLLLCVMFLFSGCQSETKEASEASLESAVTELESLIDSKNTYAVTKMIISPSNLTAAGSLELAERIVKIRANDLFTYAEAKISGDMAAVVLMIDAYSMETAILAKLEDQQWIFFIGIHVCPSEYSLRRLGLSSEQLKDAFILKRWLEDETQAGKSGLGERERLKWYLPEVPESLVIEKFYESPSPAMDHDYMWKIKVEDSEMFKGFQKQLSQKPPNYCGVNDLSEVPVFDVHPKWWRSIDFEKGTLYQYIVEVFGSKGSEKSSLFAFFDQDASYLYIQAGN
jgi:hypothetical protein